MVHGYPTLSGPPESPYSPNFSYQLFWILESCRNWLPQRRKQARYKAVEALVKEAEMAPGPFKKIEVSAQALDLWHSKPC